MTNQYNPLNHSIVQTLYGSHEEFQCDDFVQALLDHVLEEIKRVHWNLYQHEWSPTWHGDDIEDPCIPGIEFNRYYECSCEDVHKEGCPSVRPNFIYSGVVFKWYKWPGRGMSVNVNYTPAQWYGWHKSCLEQVRKVDKLSFCSIEEENLMTAFVEKYPQWFNRLSGSIETRRNARLRNK